MRTVLPSAGKKGVSGQLTVPGDKSISHRAVMLGALAEGTTRIKGFLAGEDCLATVDCFRKLGVDIAFRGETIEIAGRGVDGLRAPSSALYAANSGTTTRLLAGILAGQTFSSELDGDDSLRRRPMKRIIDPLAMMGADISSKMGLCPLRIRGSKLRGIEYRLPVASAQLKSCLLLAGLYAEGETTVIEETASRDHTEIMLASFGGDVRVREEGNGRTATVRPSHLSARDVTVPGDISSAAFFIAAGLLAGAPSLTVKNVGLNPTRTGILDVVLAMGGKMDVEITSRDGELVGDITVYRSELVGTEISGALIPRLVDELPVIALLGSTASGVTAIRDAAELRVKESDRLHTIATEYAKAGADITELDDGLVIQGGKKLRGADFTSYADHRIAMSCAVLSLIAEGRSTIDDAACAAVSYPDFFSRLEALIGEGE